MYVKLDVCASGRVAGSGGVVNDIPFSQIPRYSARNLCQWQPYDSKHDHWVVLETIGPLVGGQETIVADWGLKPRAKVGEPSDHQVAQMKANELNQVSFLANVAGRTVTRFQTNWYVAVEIAEAKRHAEIDHTPADKVKITLGVTILHYAGSWILWSDGKFTKAGGLNLPVGGAMTNAAAGLISTVRGADAGTVYLPGNWVALTKLAEIVSEDTIEVGYSRGAYAAERIEHMRVCWLDGSEGDLYAVTAGYFEGYRYDIYGTLAEAMQEFGTSPDASGLTAFPADDYQYDPTLGFVSKDD